jgi:hypothetical protein
VDSRRLNIGVCCYCNFQNLPASLLARSISFGFCRNLATCVMICLLNKSTVNFIVCMKWEFKQHKKGLICLIILNVVVGSNAVFFIFSRPCILYSDK